MTRFRRFGILPLVLLGMAGSAWIATDAGAADKPPPAKTAPKVAALPPPPIVNDPIRLTPEGLRMGMAVNEVIDFYNKVLDLDYVEIYKRTQVGPAMSQVDAALQEQKQAFVRSEVVFGNLPTGIDNSPLKGEYNYKNNETMMSLTRQGVTRYFFFWNKRLWKIYDATPLKKDGDSGAPTYLGASYKDAVGILTKRFGKAGRVLTEDPARGRNSTEVDWADKVVHVRALDRSSENIVGLVFQDRAVADRMVAIRAGQKGDEGGIDPTISGITRPGAVVDTNASAADAYTGKAHATPPAVPPAPSGAPPNKKK
jgi:hypothetical protein